MSAEETLAPDADYKVFCMGISTFSMGALIVTEKLESTKV